MLACSSPPVSLLWQSVAPREPQLQRPQLGWADTICHCAGRRRYAIGGVVGNPICQSDKLPVRVLRERDSLVGRFDRSCSCPVWALPRDPMFAAVFECTSCPTRSRSESLTALLLVGWAQRRCARGGMLRCVTTHEVGLWLSRSTE